MAGPPNPLDVGGMAVRSSSTVVLSTALNSQVLFSHFRSSLLFPAIEHSNSFVWPAASTASWTFSCGTPGLPDMLNVTRYRRPARVANDCLTPPKPGDPCRSSERFPSAAFQVPLCSSTTSIWQRVTIQPLISLESGLSGLHTSTSGPSSKLPLTSRFVDRGFRLGAALIVPIAMRETSPTNVRVFTDDPGLRGRLWIVFCDSTQIAARFTNCQSASWPPL